VCGQYRNFGLKLGGAVLVTLFLLTTWFAQPVAGVTPPTQGGRPTLPPPEQPGPGGPEGGGGGLTAESCAGLHGAVINWGFQNEPGVTLRLGDGGWEARQITATDGRYQFGPLGQGVAFLSIDLSPKQAETLRPMVDDVAIRLRCDFDMVANLGLYSSPARPDPPATLTMGVSQAALLPGGEVTFYLTLKNDMPHSISHVFVTDYLPDGLSAADVTTTRGAVEVLNGRMVTLSVGDLPQGGQEKIQITAHVDPSLAYGTRLQNTATLLYAESAADQAWANLTIGGTGGITAPSPTSTLPPSAAESVMPSPAATGTLEATAAVVAEETPTPPPPTPVAEQTPGSGDELLPITGGGAPVALPVVGIGLAVVLLGARRLREWLEAR
jgi:uncharacterized repeat protein (TIGR01451 family)